MKVIDSGKLFGTDREVECPKGAFISLRILLLEDSMGFTLCRTLVSKGGPYKWHYQNHLEACFCTKGEGIVRCLDSSQEWNISPGVCYVLDKNDPHEFTALEDVELLSVFNPPLKGDEVHDGQGSYQI